MISWSNRSIGAAPGAALIEYILLLTLLAMIALVAIKRMGKANSCAHLYTADQMSGCVVMFPDREAFIQACMEDALGGYC